MCGNECPDLEEVEQAKAGVIARKLEKEEEALREEEQAAAFLADLEAGAFEQLDKVFLVTLTVAPSTRLALLEEDVRDAA